MKKVKSKTKHSVIKAEQFLRKINIGLEKAKQIMRATTQRGIRNSVHPITRKYILDHVYLHTARFSENFYVDWVSSGNKYLSQNAGYFVLYERSFNEVYPSEFKEEMLYNMSLNALCNNEGIT